ncbi:hypothetical protein Ssi02_24210 [Sinosporangium siamense]|uniref:Uncharacterized protein n=1 Tax=Sinosporangium siamense TaxID=1367973 RepID=A0A919V4R1_9ACTN|nr:hypothetical protein Ssi02_24210 [Sinosporangium siamense]
MLPGTKRLGRPRAVGPVELAALRRMVPKTSTVTEAAHTRRAASKGRPAVPYRS